MKRDPKYPLRYELVPAVLAALALAALYVALSTWGAWH